MSFATTINCMDGRVQTCVNEYVRKRFGVDYVDVITEAGPVAVVADRPESPEMASIVKRLGVSVDKHASVGVALVAHHDCAGNPVDEATQREQLERAVAALKDRRPQLPVTGLWVNAEWKVEETLSVP